MKHIEHIIEPRKLLLMWSSPAEHRLNRVVAEIILEQDGSVSLAYLTDTSDFAAAKNEGFFGYSIFRHEQQRYPDMMDIFQKRIPVRTRGDFQKYLDVIRIRDSADLSDFALLGYSRAKIPGDNFFIEHPFDSAEPPFELMMEISGFHYCTELTAADQISIDDEVSFEAEPDNKHDSNAIRVVWNGCRIGYVSRGLLPVFHQWMRKHTVVATVERKNGTVDEPRVYVYITVR